MSDERPSLGHRARLVLWIAVIFGLPSLILVQLALGPSGYGGAPEGDQPGGELRARVVDVDGVPVGRHPVELQLWPSGGAPTTTQTLATDARGRVAFTAPPLRGKYRLMAGGGEFQRVGRERSFVEGGRLKARLGEVDLELRPGAVLEMELTDASGAPLPDGEAQLDGRALDGALFGLLGASIQATCDVVGGRGVFDGLPPFAGEVRVRFNDGRELTFHVRVPVGRERVAYELE